LFTALATTTRCIDIHGNTRYKGGYRHGLRELTRGLKLLRYNKAVNCLVFHLPAAISYVTLVRLTYKPGLPLLCVSLRQLGLLLPPVVSPTYPRSTNPSDARSGSLAFGLQRNLAPAFRSTGSDNPSLRPKTLARQPDLMSRLCPGPSRPQKAGAGSGLS